MIGASWRRTLPEATALLVCLPKRDILSVDRILFIGRALACFELWEVATLASSELHPDFQSVPARALLGGLCYELVTCVAHASGAGVVAVCSPVLPKDSPGFAESTQAGARAYSKWRYVMLSEWLDGASALKQSSGRDDFVVGEPRCVVTSASPSAEKLALYRSLFRGRADAYAHAYFNRKTNRLGYTPACANEWKRPLCEKPRIACSKCAHRMFFPLNDEALKRHFRGERSDCADVLGVYPVVDETLCYFLVADFDKGDWKSEVTAFRKACEDCHLPVAVERSRSGNGAHAWLFFEDAIEASLARSLGCALITRAMRMGGFSDFTAYDRLFPAQDTVTEDGLGNLIALPLQGRAYREGNTVFVDEEFRPYPDQWYYLSSIGRVSEEEARRVVRKLTGGPLGCLAGGMDELSDMQGLKGERASGIAKEPWSRRKRDPLKASDLPPCVHIIKANMLYVEKAGLSSRALDSIRRLAAFHNPEFYLAQAMRRTVFNKPRIVYLGEDYPEHLAIPRGCEESLLALISGVGAECHVRDERRPSLGSPPRPLAIEFAGSLRAAQEPAALALLACETGVLSAPTGFGKTVVAAYVIAQRKLKTLVLVPSTALLEQWREGLEKFLTIHEELPVLLTKTGRKSRKKQSPIGQIGGGKNAPSGLVDIALFQSLLEAGDVAGTKEARSLVGEYDMVICDECHHVGATGFEKVMRAVSARYVYGLSATPKRKDGLTPMVFMHCGSLRHRVLPKEQAEQQTFRRVLIPRFTNVRLEHMEPGVSFNQILDQVCCHEGRNQIIVDDVSRALAGGRTPLVLTKRVEHAGLLAGELERRGWRVIVLTGEGSARERRERLTAVRAVAPDCRFAVVATGSYAGEGFDEPRLDALFLAAPVSWEGLLTQYAGRLHREYEGKEDVLVYDYIDMNVPMLDRMYKKRIKTYAELGYAVLSDEDSDATEGLIFEGGDAFDARIALDMHEACTSLLICASHANVRRVVLFENELEKALKRGVSVEVLLREPTKVKGCASVEAAARRLAGFGCSVRVTRDVVPDVLVCDARIVWHGGASPLSFSRSGECSLRIVHSEVACHLLDHYSLQDSAN